MRSSALRECTHLSITGFILTKCPLTISSLVTFSRVRKSPEFIPLLAYLLPRPARPFVPSQTDFWTQSLVDYYPEGLKNGMFVCLII